MIDIYLKYIMETAVAIRLNLLFYAEPFFLYDLIQFI